MKTNELLELASLDAMGLLDPNERDAFERAFESAPPAVQAQVRREQTRLAAFDSVLPQVNPPLGLKAKVLAALRDAMEAVSNRPRADVIASIRAPRGVNPLWRVGAIAAAAAAVALAISTLELTREYDDITATAVSNAAIDTMRERFEPGFDRILLSDQTVIVQLKSDQASDAQRSRPSGVLLVDSKTRTGRLIAQGLSSTDEYELVLINKDGRQIKTALSFRGSPAQMEYRTLGEVQLENVASIALIRISDGQAILSANEMRVEDIASVYFTTTTDLTATYPAVAARQLGWFDLALMCGHEMAVPTGLPKCIRVLIHWNTTRTNEEIVHVYLRAAKSLRPDRDNIPPVRPRQISPVEAAVKFLAMTL